MAQARRPAPPGSGVAAPAPVEDEPTSAQRQQPDSDEFAGPRRTLPARWTPFVRALAVLYALVHLLVLNLYPIDPWLFRAGHLCAAAVLILLLFRPGRRAAVDRVPVWDLLLATAAIGVFLYVWVELDGLLFRAGAMWTWGDVAMGVVGTLLVLEVTRRVAGLALPIIALLFVLYAFVGPWLPGVLHHRGYDVPRFFTYIFSDQGILGITTSVSSTYVILFVTLGAFMGVSRISDYFNDLALALFGWARGGPAKATVVSGVLFGSISGSAVANVVASGTFTIPMMRRVGYDRATAGAIEATSSTGGQITPPVLGAGAFLMAEMTGIPYATIAIAAILPCWLFYVACYAHVELHARRHGLVGLPRAELPPLRAVLRKLYLFAPLAVLVAALYAGYSPLRSATLAILATIVASWLAREAPMGPRAVLDALERATMDVLQLVAVCGCAGIVVGVIALTGIGGRFSQLLLGLAAGHALLAMVFTMLIALVLGMGMPTTAAYAIAASVLAPGLARMGVEPLVAHFFIFYFAVVSAITPPVALASFAAATMARADPWKTSWIAVKLGLAAFIVPFMFYTSPVLLAQGHLLSILLATLTATLGVILLACAADGWLAGALSIVPRLLLAAAAGCLMVPEHTTDLLGVGLAAGVAALQRWPRLGRSAAS
ncbi:MAG: TRAP transporter permease [Geminicoccaceae bacterium]|nr:TRAP transporter permease [Geminicoccaceae bacterium]MDW8369934.1 TRAP transporter permease [Geminicoccaceae bacterium]